MQRGKTRKGGVRHEGLHLEHKCIPLDTCELKGEKGQEDTGGIKEGSVTVAGIQKGRSVPTAWWWMSRTQASDGAAALNLEPVSTSMVSGVPSTVELTSITDIVELAASIGIVELTLSPGIVELASGPDKIIVELASGPDIVTVELSSSPGIVELYPIGLTSAFFPEVFAVVAFP